MGSELLGHARWAAGRGVLFDHRKLDIAGVGEGALAAIRRFHEANDAGIGGGRCAIVVGEGRSEAWGQLWERGRRAEVSNVVRVFEEMEAAIGWVSGSEDAY